MNKLKRSGPSTDPCGTPTNNWDQEPFEVLIFVLCHLSERYDLISLSECLSNHKHIA